MTDIWSPPLFRVDNFSSTTPEKSVQNVFALMFGLQTAKEIYRTSPSVKHIIHRVRNESQKFERYQHNKDLVTLLNCFADKTQLIPPGWEMKVDQTGKVGQ